MKQEKVIVGLSGGVDSAVSVYLLQQEGYLVEGMYMKTYESQGAETEYQDAQKVADKLGIKLYKAEFMRDYKDVVYKYFVDELKNGRTGNPCVVCNKHFKFGAFIDKAKEYGADYIAMGHYCISEKDSAILKKGIDTNKDQTYFLSLLSKEQIKKTIFPLGRLTKPEVRKIAEKLDLPVKQKKDSTDLCFIGVDGYDNYVTDFISSNTGNMITVSGEIVGKHRGISHYTIGQRKGLGIGGNKKYGTEPWFVVGKDINTNDVIVAQGYDNDYLYSDSCLVCDVNYYGEKINSNISAKFRYRQKDNNVSVEWVDDNSVMVYFEKPIRAVTPGQIAVFYDKDVCLGGGFIDKVYRNKELRKY